MALRNQAIALILVPMCSLLKVPQIRHWVSSNFNGCVDHGKRSFTASAFGVVTNCTDGWPDKKFLLRLFLCGPALTWPEIVCPSFLTPLRFIGRFVAMKLGRGAYLRRKEQNLLPLKFMTTTREHQLKGKYHCMADLLFILFIFSCFSYVEMASALLVWLNPNQSNRRSAEQWSFPYGECSPVYPMGLTHMCCVDVPTSHK